jgi:HlyD family secretion protein
MEKNSKGPMKLLFCILTLAVIVLVALNYKNISNKLFGSNINVSQRIVTVKRGNIKTFVLGSGSIYSTKDNMIYSKVSGTITAVNFKAGDKVKAGDVIYQIDDKNAENSLDMAKATLEQSQVAADASNEDVSNLSITAPQAGQVSKILINKGDTIQSNTPVLTITDTSQLYVLLPFNATDIKQIAVGQVADVNISTLMQSAKGIVTYISNQPSTTDLGGQVYTVEIQINNPGGLFEGMTASADITTSEGTVSSTSNAQLSYLNKQVVASKVGGTVENILVKENQTVGAGDILVEMQNDDITRAQKNADLNVAASEDNVSSSLTQVGYYKITSPIDGVLSSVSLQVGDTVSVGTQVAEVSDATQMKFDIPVDSVDLPQVTVGQKVNVSLASTSNTGVSSVQGEVDSVSVKGSLQSGITTFPITIKIDGSSDVFKEGMKANAEIQVNNEENVLYVPVEAVINEDGKNYVMLKENNASGSSSKEDTDYYAGTERKEVEVGVKNDTNIEIKSGLEEGDQIVLPIE